MNEAARAGTARKPKGGRHDDLTEQQVKRGNPADRQARRPQAAGPPAAALEDSAPARGDSPGPPQHREVLDLVRAYNGTAEDRLRKKFVDLVKSVAKSKS